MPIYPLSENEIKFSRNAYDIGWKKRGTIKKRLKSKLSKLSKMDINKMSYCLSLIPETKRELLTNLLIETIDVEKRERLLKNKLESIEKMKRFYEGKSYYGKKLLQGKGDNFKEVRLIHKITNDLSFVSDSKTAQRILKKLRNLKKPVVIQAITKTKKEIVIFRELYERGVIIPKATKEKEFLAKCLRFFSSLKSQTIKNKRMWKEVSTYYPYHLKKDYHKEFMKINKEHIKFYLKHKENLQQLKNTFS